MKKKSRLEIIAEICRVILGLVFVFSGLMKSIEPWGASVKFQEYFTAFGAEWFSGWSMPLAILLSSVELVVGLMLLVKVRLRIASLISVLFMAFFTVLTLIIAIWNPLQDCGCLGSAVKLENWHTFYKNLVLMPMSIVVLLAWRKDRAFDFTSKDIWLIMLFVVSALTVNLYSWRYLPVVDMLPYKVGVNLRTDVKCWRCEDRSLKLVYRDRITENEVEFELTDTTWYDSARWEYVTTKNHYHDNPPTIVDYDFALWREGYNEVDKVIFHEGTVYIIAFQEIDKMAESCRNRINDYVARLVSNGDFVVCVSGIDPVLTQTPANIELGGYQIPYFGMEKPLLQTILRADAGVVVVRDGVIADKKTCWSLR